MEVVKSSTNFGWMQEIICDHKSMTGGGGISVGFFIAPGWIVAKKAIVNVLNSDEKCLLAALHPAEKDPARVTKYKPYEHEFDMSCLTFPVNHGNETMLAKFETSNNISINILGLYDDDGEGAYENDDGNDDNSDNSMRITITRNHPSYHLA